jgi:hypothetical protein
VSGYRDDLQATQHRVEHLESELHRKEQALKDAEAKLEAAKQASATPTPYVFVPHSPFFRDITSPYLMMGMLAGLIPISLGMVGRMIHHHHDHHSWRHHSHHRRHRPDRHEHANKKSARKSGSVGRARRGTVQGQLAALGGISKTSSPRLSSYSPPQSNLERLLAPGGPSREVVLAGPLSDFQKCYDVENKWRASVPDKLNIVFQVSRQGKPYRMQINSLSGYLTPQMRHCVQKSFGKLFIHQHQNPTEWFQTTIQLTPTVGD